MLAFTVWMLEASLIMLVVVVAVLLLVQWKYTGSWRMICLTLSSISIVFGIHVVLQDGLAEFKEKHRAELTVQPKDVSTEDIQLMALAVIEEVVKRDAVIRDAEKALKRCLEDQQELAEFRKGQKACKCDGQNKLGIGQHGADRYLDVQIDVTQAEVEKLLDVKNNRRTRNDAQSN